MRGILRGVVGVVWMRCAGGLFGAGYAGGCGRVW